MNSNDRDEISAEVAVVGGGPSGLTAAIALASAGIETALIAAAPAISDNRTTALLAGSVAALEVLGVWEHCAAQSAPLRTMRIIDDRPGLLRAPEVTFSADEIGLEAFGHNIENRYLVAALEARAGAFPSLTRLTGLAEHIVPDAEGATIRMADGRSVRSRLLVGSDGRHSLARKAAGLTVNGRSYPQVALTYMLSHTRAHADASTEFHTATGPFTLVPLPGRRSSLVWVAGPAEAAQFRDADPAMLAREIERRSHSILGKITVEPGGGAFPLGMQSAERFAQDRIALIGEAAHLVPPIGAQGLNLGLRDAATIAELVADARRAGEDVGADALLARYDDRRRGDVRTRSTVIDMLNRSLLTDFLPVHGLRGFGLYMLDRVGPLRRTVMREGVSPQAGAPRLMRGEPV